MNGRMKPQRGQQRAYVFGFGGGVQLTEELTRDMETYARALYVEIEKRRLARERYWELEGQLR